ncbi:hypothetical protein GDO86_011077 [Hymenochirus boettgeri]|uniref:Methyltransferase like 4 n=1 Tax=Hymenochirus boettgeri TaxID=247094 RepID=A0A8T2JFQ5_9PIPI|nr:hypothetical protein GDO86_011077 [Hymenochirus boettgeri]
MSVVYKNAAGWLLDELSLIRKWYHHPACCQHDVCTRQLYNFKEDFFLIFRPHITNHFSAATHLESCLESNQSKQTTTPERKKRKRSCAFNQGELDAMEYHKKVTDLILNGAEALVQEGLNRGFLQPFIEIKDNKSKTEPGLATSACQLAELCNMAKCIPLITGAGHKVQFLETEIPLPQGISIVSQIIENKSECPSVVDLLGEKYIIPPKSSFLLSDISCMEPLLQYKTYNIIVIDPPWENKSVKRSKRYSSLSPKEIKQIPLPSLAAQNCLVITWVTNKQKHLRFVKEELYPHWSVRTLGEWHWTKITKSGEFVFPLDSLHKKPYEVLVLGRFQNAENSTKSSAKIHLNPVPEHRLIVSIPCKLHSHKPPLGEVLKEYVEPGVECLELFARNLQPGWTSWGNEVLKFQHMDYFTSIEKD